MVGVPLPSGAVAPVPAVVAAAAAGSLARLLLVPGGPRLRMAAGRTLVPLAAALVVVVLLYPVSAWMECDLPDGICQTVRGGTGPPPFSVSLCPARPSGRCPPRWQPEWRGGPRQAAPGLVCPGRERVAPRAPGVDQNRSRASNLDAASGGDPTSHLIVDGRLAMLKELGCEKPAAQAVSGPPGPEDR